MKLKAEEGKEYILNVKITADLEDCFTLYTNHRRILLKNAALKKGEGLNLSFAVAMRKAEFQKQPGRNDGEIELALLGKGKIFAEAKKAEIPVIYTLGDSTVCDQTYSGGDEIHRCCGWGQTLGMYFKDGFAVSNHAEQGTHTADCLNCHIKPVLGQIKTGDIVLVQFGHNDQKQEFLKPFGGYKENLGTIVDMVKKKGGRCILCTPINRLIYVDGKLNSYLDEYAAAVRQTAKEKGLSCIDLHRFTSELYETMGEAAENLFYHGESLDRTHMNDIGASVVGEFVGREVKKILA